MQETNKRNPWFGAQEQRSLQLVYDLDFNGERQRKANAKVGADLAGKGAEHAAHSPASMYSERELGLGVGISYLTFQLFKK